MFRPPKFVNKDFQSCSYSTVHVHSLHCFNSLLQIKNCLCKSDIANRVIPQSRSNCNGVAHSSSKFSSNKEQQQQQNDKPVPCWCPDLRYIIIDMTPVMFVDSSGAKMLDKVCTL